MTTISRKWGKRARYILSLGILAVACTGSTKESSVGGESSFLRKCSDDCQDGLKCISNVCTRSCKESKDSCSDLAEKAVCTDASSVATDVAVCDVACKKTTGCGDLGSDFSCEAGFCRGASAASSGGQGGESGGSGAPSEEGGSAGSVASGASCRVAYQEYPSGTTGIPSADGYSCGGCDCTDGTLNCTYLGLCPSGSPIVVCPANIQTDPVLQEMRPFIAGDSLSLSVTYGGGCGDHDFVLCYEPLFAETSPVTASLHLIHDGHGDSCQALKTTGLRFDLASLGAAYNEQYQVAGGLVRTDYGLYVFGEATCDERTGAAADQLARSLAQTVSTCSDVSDCKVVSTATACVPDCGSVVSATTPADQAELSASELVSRVSEIDQGQCSVIEELGCAIPVVDCAAVVMDCVENKCVRVAN
jgi:hypothetical protein